MISAVMLSRVIGYLREAYIAWAFGAGLNTDAYVGAFNLPDFLNYILAGGTASITFISIYTRHTSKGRNKEAQDAFNSTITIMTTVVCLGTVLLEIFTPQLERLIFPHFSADQLQLCVHLTRILLPGQIFFYAGGIVSAVLFSRRMFLYPAFSPIFYNLFIIVGGVIGARRFGISSLAYGALVRRVRRSVSHQRHRRGARRPDLPLQLRLAQSGISRVGEAFHPPDAGSFAGFRR